MVLGLLVGIVRMILDFIYPLPQCYETDTRPDVIKYVHYLYFSIILSLFTLAVVVCISLATEKPTEEQVRMTQHAYLKLNGALCKIYKPLIIRKLHIVTHETDVNVCCVSQLSRLMWSTRFDPVKRSKSIETGTFTIDHGVDHEKKTHGSVREHTNGVF